MRIEKKHKNEVTRHEPEQQATHSLSQAIVRHNSKRKQ